MAFFGSGAFGIPSLDALHAAHDVPLVVTQPPRPAGRKRTLTPTPIHQHAESLGLPVAHEENVNEQAFVDRIAGLALDASIVIAFGQKLGEPLIEAMGRLAVNLHGSLLPAYRGAAPIQRAVMNGDATTGVCVIGLAQRMDAGPIYAERSLDIEPTETSGELHDRLALLGPDAVLAVLDDLAHDRLAPTAQDESLATRARKLTKAEGTVAFDQPAERVRAMINGLNPWPGCRVRWTRAADGSTCEIILRRASAEPSSSPSRTDETSATHGVALDDAGRFACETGAIRVLDVQAPGKPVQTWDVFARGQRFSAGDRLDPCA
ncbi:MAG: methionyl-tRNA formyltransferase [Planctomycetota bacterium]